MVNNTLRGCWGEASKVAPEYWWLEAGSSNDLLIAGNRISHCMGDGIAVYAEAGAAGSAPAGAHNNITIERNCLTDVEGKDIRVTSTKGLILKGILCDNADIYLEDCLSVQTDIANSNER